MRPLNALFSTGLPGLDAVLTGLRGGDNVVWEVDSVADFAAFVDPFCAEVRRRALPLVYFRFGDHPPLVPSTAASRVHELRPDEGFEGFISEIFDIIEQEGAGACYVFDCLTDLAVDWYSDRMLGNFFRLTCPYLYSYDTIAYFALMRDVNAAVATQAIHGTAQVVIDVFRRPGGLFVHPLKVYRRHSSTMYMLHAWEGQQFTPVTRSAVISEIRASLAQPWIDFDERQRDVWRRAFREAHEITAQDPATPVSVERSQALQQRLIRMMVTRDERVFTLVARYFTLPDLLSIGHRMIGTGLIGGKSVGMLLARAILREREPDLAAKLEVHDSFFIGSDVFYTYLVLNNCWWVRRRLKNPEFALEGSIEARQRMVAGVFPRDITGQFAEMLEYFGQSPIIVRSSSLLEDAYGNAFSGKYESVFCANQGTPEQRLEDFVAAIRTIYASTMDREALEYRIHWGLLESDEQMALLVQRVSGEVRGSLFYPEVAGVGFSFNPFVWHPDIDPRAGFLRLVFGLGTRAVDRLDDDHTRIVSLSAPALRPEGSSVSLVARQAQRKVDLLHLPLNQKLTLHFSEVIEDTLPTVLPMLASRDREAEAMAREQRGVETTRWVLTFDDLLAETEFVSDMRRLLATLESAYEHAVDVEFTLNFVGPTEYRINLLQCRPFQVRRSRPTIAPLDAAPAGEVVLRTHGPVIGHSRSDVIDEVVYVVPETYSRLSWRDRHVVGKLVGRIVHARRPNPATTLMLVGPGRWGTSTPELGVPVTFADIDAASVICECALMHEGLVPDVSLGSHFFNDIVELDMLYLAVHPERDGDVLDRTFLATAPSRLLELCPDAAAWEGVVRVIAGASTGEELFLRADAMSQEATLLVRRPVL
ncbi:MAG: pyruvate, phosphate dikinase [Polyangiaceae bacterium]|nr:pyruvate, phosphate dikinase [Polyangiaceae bacterium]